MEKGAVVSFPVKGHPRLAVVEGPEGKNSLRVTDTFGNSLTVAQRDIVFSTTEWKLDPKPWVTASGLNDWATKAKGCLGDVDLATVWELLSTDGPGPYSLEVLGGCLWDSLTGERAWALFTSLEADRLFFKEKGGRFEARSAGQVEELRKQQSALASKEKLQAELAGRLEARLADKTSHLEPQDLERFEAVKKLALFGEEAADKHAALDLLKLAGRPQTEASALQFLVDLGLWHRHENLDVLRAGLSPAFEPELEAAALSLLRAPPDSGSRIDLTALASLTIDDDTTTEVDDALALETLSDGRLKYWIHIADPGHWVARDSALDLEARRRGTTVYLPSGRFTMFPPVLAEGPFSLRPGVESAALSFGCVLGADGALIDLTVEASTIRVDRRLNYQQAQELASAGDPLLVALATAARLREAWRIAQGAVMIHLPESEVKVDLSAGTVNVGVYAAEAARDWVAEFMVLAGEAAARFAAEKQIPVLYRVQRAGDPVDVSHLPEGPAREFGKIVTMTRSLLSQEAGPHAGLGLPSYVQATSPIRRYGDLAVHRQLKAAAAGEVPPLDSEALATLAAELDPLNAQSARLERNADRYWITEYLARQKGKTWPAVIVGWFRDDEAQAQVLLTDLGYRALVKLTRKHPLGGALTLKVVAADARREVLTFAEV
ncbi:MAG: RNB domain-containing ribonuclease [Spirochaetales bacterium]